MVLLPGCAPAVVTGRLSATPPAEYATRYHDADIAFTYPGSWTSQPFPNDPPSSFSRVITYLSTDRLHDPCTTTKSPQSISTVCAWPVGHLSPSGVLVTWTADGTPGFDLASQAGATTTIASRPARIATQGPGDCAAIGGRLTITASIDLGDGTHFYQMIACLNGQDSVLSQQQTSVMAMLSTVQLAR